MLSRSPRPRGHRVAVSLLGAAVLSMAAAPALAHVTANPRTAAADGFAKLDFRVPHGCDGSPTVELAVQIPAGVVSVKPEQVPGWEVETVRGELDEPHEGHGQTVTEGVVEVIWRTIEDPLPDDQFRDFGLSVRMPDRPGETLYFPAVQVCEEGEIRWIQIPQEGQDEPDEPAPAVLLEASAGGHGGATATDTGGDTHTTSDAQAHAAPVAAAATTASPALVAWIALAFGVIGTILGATGLRRRA